MKSNIERLLDQVDFKPTGTVPENTEGLPYVTHEGVLKISDTEIKVFVLSNGQRIIPKEELRKIFDIK